MSRIGVVSALASLCVAATEPSLAREDASHPHAEYLDFKKNLEKAFGLTYQIQPTVMFQWGNPNGGTAAIQGILGPSLNWDMFDNPDIGQGSIQFGYTANHYWSQQTGVSLSNRLNILSQINDSAANNYYYSQLTYTHVFPGNLLHVTVGQYGFSNFDSNQYANNQQMNFINYALSQNGSQAYGRPSRRHDFQRQ
jgi:hypothetical protein